MVDRINKLKSDGELEPRGNLKHRSMRYSCDSLDLITRSYANKSKCVTQVYQNPGYRLVTSDYGLFVSSPGYSMPPHIDTINDGGVFSYLKYAVVIYLNDEYTGGSIYFPNIDEEYFPKKGDAVVFPSNDEKYLHGVKEILSGNRYTLAYWYSEDGDWVTYFN
jgi:hypothetical protein